MLGASAKQGKTQVNLFTRHKTWDGLRKERIEKDMLTYLTVLVENDGKVKDAKNAKLELKRRC